MHIVQRRGGHVETRTPVRAVAVIDGQIALEWGPDIRSPWRSAAKPFQLFASLEALGDPELDSVEVALGASSHAGQPDHVSRLRQLQRRLGVPEDALLCGAEPPLHAPSWEAALRAGGGPLPIYNDCSGKHTFFAAASAARGWASDYRGPDHPLQARVHALVEALAEEEVGRAVDGCGVPVMCLSVTGMARAWGWLASAMARAGDPWAEGGGDGGVERDLARAARIGWAMARHPWWTSGDGRLDLDVSCGARLPMVGKIGAQGVFCIAVPSHRMGVAVKTLSGDEPSLGVAVAAVLAELLPLGWSAPDPWPWAVVRNVVGDIVGDRLAEAGLGV